MPVTITCFTHLSPNIYCSVFLYKNVGLCIAAFFCIRLWGFVLNTYLVLYCCLVYQYHNCTEKPKTLNGVVTSFCTFHYLMKMCCTSLLDSEKHGSFNKSHRRRSGSLCVWVVVSFYGKHYWRVAFQDH